MGRKQSIEILVVTQRGSWFLVAIMEKIIPNFKGVTQFCEIFRKVLIYLQVSSLK